ncbi:glycosyltransferase family 1 protein [Parabacteroides sp. ZJ-118]|uniref:glycosyltransferase family 4 protein n=1 Tax=Parabacteroides sp. ZJ-118 TaxID=2709398 RepID=UPI0013EB867F|nr:glycosyltransferase family 1 protein [Parabacteroides sp. ZJ-118]
MRIAIEAQRIFRTNKHGMDFVALESIRELQKLDHENEYYIFVSPGEDRCLEETDNMRIVEVRCPSYPLWEQVALPNAIAKVKPDLLHCTSNTAPIHCPVPLILTLHDIIFLEPKQGGNTSWYQNMGWHYRRLVVPRILPKCKRIITVSHFERDRIREALRLPKERIIAIHNGYSQHFHPLSNVSAITRKYIGSDDYLFFLGNTDPKKNTPRTLKAYSLYLKRSSKKRPLLVADLKEDKLDTLLKEQHIEEIKPYLSYPGYIPNTDLAYLYNGAFAFLYTSLRESFGIPMLEAMACGTPVIAGNTSAMPEIAGDGGILVDPLKEEEIVNALLRLEEKANYYDRQVAYGLERVKEFSWEKTAKALLQLYETF